MKTFTVCMMLGLLAFAGSTRAEEPGDGDVELSMVTEARAARRPEGVKAKARKIRNETEDADVEGAEISQAPARVLRPAPIPARPAPVPVEPAPVLKAEPEIAAVVPLGPAVVHVDEANFDAEVAQYRGLILIDFYTPMCGPCRKTAPIVEEWGEKFRGQVKVVKIDGSAAPKLADRFEVQTVPCLVLMKDGKIRTRRNGEPPRDLMDLWVRENR